jgi:hypothetical protein
MFCVCCGATAAPVQHSSCILCLAGDFLCCRNINLVRHTEQIDSNSSSSQVCNNLQLQLLTVARVHEAMAEGLAGEGEANFTREMGGGVFRKLHFWRRGDRSSRNA